MIHVRMFRSDEEKCITGFHVQGHARFAPKGKDIVCAAVSAVAFGTLEALRTLTVVSCDYDAPTPGVLDVRVGQEAVHDHDAQLLLRSFVVMIGQIARHYPEYVRLYDADQASASG